MMNTKYTNGNKTHQKRRVRVNKMLTSGIRGRPRGTTLAGTSGPHPHVFVRKWKVCEKPGTVCYQAEIFLLRRFFSLSLSLFFLPPFPSYFFLTSFPYLHSSLPVLPRLLSRERSRPEEKKEKLHTEISRKMQDIDGFICSRRLWQHWAFFRQFYHRRQCRFIFFYCRVHMDTVPIVE